MNLINIKRVAFEIRYADKAAQVLVSKLETATSLPSLHSIRSPVKTWKGIEDRLAFFLEERMPKRSAPAVASVQQTPQPNVEGPAVSVGQHKIFPIHPHEPKTTVIPNPAVPFVPQTSNPGPVNDLIGTFDFVCEDDVRKALEKKQNYRDFKDNYYPFSTRFSCQEHCF